MALTGVGESSITNPFYDFLNECLLRGLSGLLNLETCQFVWDQCFVVGKYSDSSHNVVMIHVHCIYPYLH